MTKFRVEWQEITYFDALVEADDEEEAIALATSDGYPEGLRTESEPWFDHTSGYTVTATEEELS